MLTVISDSADRDGSTATAGSASSVIDELVREGARRMLAEALRAEVDAYVARFADERDDNGRRLVAAPVAGLLIYFAALPKYREVPQKHQQ